MNTTIPETFIEMCRVEVDQIVDSLGKLSTPMTTEELALMMFDKKNLTEAEHSQILSVIVALLLQQVVHA